jgi:hypothetical protein
MGTESKENSLLEQPVAFVASEDPQGTLENSHRFAHHRHRSASRFAVARSSDLARRVPAP